MKYLVGIDCSTKSHSIFILNERKEKIKCFSIPNDLPGFLELRKCLLSYPDHRIAFELSHGPLIDFLRSIGERHLYSINPLKIKRYKETYIVSGNKTDSVDAQAIALYLFVNEKNLRPMMFNSKELEKLRTYEITYDRLVKDQTRYINRLHFVIRQYFPLYDDLFAKFGRKVMLGMLLEYPLWDMLKSASEEDIERFLILKNYRVKKNIQRILGRVRSYEQITSKSEEMAHAVEARTIARILLIIIDEIESLRASIGEILNQHRLGNIFLSLPGAGTILASKMLTIFGDKPERFTHANQLQSLIGTAPRNFSSGKMTRNRMRRACNKQSRTTLYLYAFTSIRYSSWARVYYDKQREKGKTHSVSVRALSNKWVKKIFFMWKNQRLYSEEFVQKEKENQKNLEVA